MNKKYFAITLFISVCCASTSSMALEEPRLLPKGISRVRFVGVTANRVNQKLNDNGAYTSLGGANQSVTVKDMAAANKDLATLVDGLNSIKQGLGDGLYSANLYQDISLQQNIMGTAFEYGISERWNFGIRFRMVERHLRSRFRVDATNNSDAYSKAMSENADPPEILKQGLGIVSGLDQGFWDNTVYASKGYDVPSDFDRLDFGYTELGFKYAVFADETYATSLLAGIRLPTGKDANIRNPLDQGTGGNVWGVGLQAFQEVSPTKVLAFTTAAKYEYYFQDEKIMAVPKSANDPLPSLLPSEGQVQSIKRKVGGLFEWELASILRFPGNKFTFWGAYQYRNKATDQYTGPGNLFYSGLEKNTNYTSHTAEVGGGFSTIQLYRQKKFFMPMQVEALYNTTLAGVNTPDVSFGRMDVKFYF